MDMERALQLYQAGQLAAAETIYRAIVQADPDRDEALHMLAIIAGDSDRLAEGLVAAERAVQLAPDSFIYRNTLGNLLRRLGRHSDAEPHFRHAVAQAPGHPVLLVNLAACLIDLDDPVQAIGLVQQALNHEPRYADAYLCLGTAFARLGDLGNAAACFQNTLTLAPNHPAALCGLADMKLRRRDFVGAIADYRQAQVARPNFAEAELGEAHALLALGQYELGWRKYEARWHVLGGKSPSLGLPPWTGEALDRRTILIWSERGFGDVIQFVRFVPALARLGATVVLEVPAPLRALIAASPAFAGMTVIGTGENRPPIDFHLPMLSLPHLLGTTLDALPADPYLQADPELVARWRERLGSSPGHRIGLVWSGNTVPNIPSAAMLRGRAATLAAMAPLGALPDAVFYSLQKGEAAAEAANPPPGFRLIDLTAELTDFAETAALIAALDHIVTVDTSVAHLAGALGKSASVALMVDGCWRWLVERDDSPWYPSLRLFRQQEPGDWIPVFDRIARSLTIEAATP